MHREAYYTEQTIDERASRFAEECRAYSGQHAVDPEPGKAALLVIDMQRIFLDPNGSSFIPSAPAILPRIGSLADAFRAAGRPVILTRHLNTAGDAGMMMRWWGELIEEGDPESVIVEGLAPPGAPVLVKHQYDAFHATDLERSLHGAGVEQLVITGVMTHLCCESTARAAFVRGFAVFPVADGMATYNADLHRGSLISLSHGFGTVVITAEILERLGGQVSR